MISENAKLKKNLAEKERQIAKLEKIVAVKIDDMSLTKTAQLLLLMCRGFLFMWSVNGTTKGYQ